MKRMNSKRKLISYVALWSIIIGSLLSYSPETHVLSATGVPEVTLTAPAEDSMLDDSKVDVTGKVFDDTTPPEQLSVKVFEQQEDSSQPVEITNDGLLSLVKIKDENGEFTFTKSFSEGKHSISIVVTDQDGFSNMSNLSFTVKQAAEPSPTNDVDGTAMVQSSNSEKTLSEVTAASQASGENSAAEPTTAEDSLALAALSVDEIGNRPYLAHMYLIPKGAGTDYQPDGEVPESFLPAEDMTRVPLDYQILIDIRSSKAFNKTQPLITFFGDTKGTEEPEKSYTLSDGLTANIYTFTPEKKLNPGTTYYIYFNPNLIVPRFLKFTTVSMNEEYQFNSDGRPQDYIHGSYSNVTNACAYCHSTHMGKNPKLENRNGESGNDLCLSCHDGTMSGVPDLKNYEHTSHYSDASVSCSTCHNPHAAGTKNNPNSLKADYKKASTAVGKANDFSLCLSCHNGKVSETTGTEISNINQYYDENNKFINQSGHNITATVDSGSQLNGQIPCAECHDTHGSKNLKMLRESLGNVKIEDSAKLYVSEGIEWNASNERNFCLSCHSNKTELYGTKAAFSMTKKNGEPNTGHQDPASLCSSCHGGENKSFKEAAHAPMKLDEQTP